MDRPLQPTIWRTCRVVANRKRLEILALLIRERSRTVSNVAKQLGISVAAASQYLRALEARGLLTCRRIGRRVEYRLPDGNEGTHVGDMVSALAKTLGSGAQRERVFKLATAFTHPRRVAVYRSISKGRNCVSDIGPRLRISQLALQRHLEKLELRGFVVFDGRRYHIRRHAHPFGRVLAKLATDRD